MRKPLFGAGVLAALLLPVGAPSSTEAVAAAMEPGIFRMGSSLRVEFETKATNGYAIHVEGSVRKVTLSAGGPAGVADYTVPGRVSRRGIRANFGKRGQIDVMFRPGSRLKLETPPSRCTGKPRVMRWGRFVGTIRFKGERGYTELRRRSAPGWFRAKPRWECGGRRSDGRARAAASEGLAILDFSNRRLGLEASVLGIGPAELASVSLFFVELRERRGRMRIVRSAFGIGEKGSFSFDEDLTVATVRPPAPFSGRATFRRRPPGKGTSWTGSLAVRLPGTARIRLTGPRFHPRLYREDEDSIAKAGTGEGPPQAGI